MAGGPCCISGRSLSSSQPEGCFGLDQCQARLYTAILRHIVLVMAALAICAVTAARLRDRTDAQAPPPARPDDKPPADPGLIPLTIHEVKRLLAAALSRPRPPGHAAQWLEWRRRHQARPWIWKTSQAGTVCALAASRGEPRDYADVAAALARYGPSPANPVPGGWIQA